MDLSKCAVWPHWGALTVSVKVRCSIEVASGIFPVNFHTKWLLWSVHVHFDCAGLHEMEAAAGASGMFPTDFHIKWFLWRVHVHFVCAGSHKKRGSCLGRAIFPVSSRIKWLCSYTNLANYRELLQISCQETSQRSCTEILPEDLLWRFCTETWCREQRSWSEILW